MSYKEIFVILFFLLMTAAVIWITQSPYPSTVTIHEAVIKLEIADTALKRAQGLSGRADLPADRGLLFVYNEPTRPGIWMKQMRFPIDILWLDADYKIVDQHRNVSPDTFPQIFKPKAPAQYVLELRGGTLDRLD